MKHFMPAAFLTTTGPDARRHTRRNLPRHPFRTGWVAAFLGVVLILGAVFWVSLAR
jgi:hypothetical protein